MAIENQLSRPEKLTNAQTVLYEITMLRYAKGCLESEGASWTTADNWAYLEVFLLHFRNLLEFFSGSAVRRLQDDDLTVERPTDIWGSDKPDADALDKLKRNDLFTKYERDARPKSISKYLQHCTTQRTSEARWNVGEMYRDLEPTMLEFESLVPKGDREHALHWQKTMIAKHQKRDPTYHTTFSDSGASKATVSK